MDITRSLRYIKAWIYVSTFEMLSNTQLNSIRLSVFVLALLPFLRLLYAGYANLLGANPLEFLTRNTGDWALYFLVLTLCITPLRQLTKLTWLIRLRRMLGLYSFFYASLHLACFIWFDHFFEVQEIIADILKRPFVLMGALTWFSILPLALTSHNKIIRVLGGKRWQLLHRLVYFSAIAAVLHYFWMKAGKHDFSQPALFGTLVAGLLLYRVVKRWHESRRQPGF